MQDWDRRLDDQLAEPALASIARLADKLQQEESYE